MSKENPFDERKKDKKRYLETEKNFRELAGRLRIPMSHLDFVFWYRETGDIFK